MKRLIGSLGVILAILASVGFLSVGFSIPVHAQDSKADARLAALEKENAALLPPEDRRVMTEK